MTLRMLDSITPANLPGGADAYAGYADGEWPDAPAITRLFPGKPVLTITVLASRDAGCLDIENGDATPGQAPVWVQRQHARGLTRPVLYASVSAMGAVLAALAAAGITRGSVRLWSAHYGAGQHICGPATCRQVTATMDGTQWRDNAPGLGGSQVDESDLAGGFFTTTPAASWQETMMKQLPQVKPGAKGEPVRTVQALCGARGHPVTVDGVFGPKTETAVKAVQAAGHVTADGVAGPATWPLLLGI